MDSSRPAIDASKRAKTFQSSSRTGNFWSRTPSRRSTQPDTSQSSSNDPPVKPSITLSRNVPPGYVGQTVSAYHLPWPKLRKWLMDLFDQDADLDMSLLEKQVRPYKPSGHWSVHECVTKSQLRKVCKTGFDSASHGN